MLKIPTKGSKTSKDKNTPNRMLRFYTKTSHSVKLYVSMVLFIRTLWPMELQNNSLIRLSLWKSRLFSGHSRGVIPLTLDTTKLSAETEKVQNTTMSKNAKKTLYCIEEGLRNQSGVKLHRWAKVWWPRVWLITSEISTWRSRSSEFESN